MLLVSAVGSAMAAAWSPALAREVVVLPGVVGPTGVLTGVDTQGPGTLTVGAQDVNTGNDVGGAITTTAANTANIVFTDSSVVTGFVGTVGSTFLNISAGANGETVTFTGPVFSTTFSLSGTGTVNFNGGFTSNTGSTMDFAGDGFINVGAGQTVLAAITNSAGASTGTLTLNANSILDGAVGAASGLKLINVVGGDALITGQANAATFDLGTNTLNIAGAFGIPVAGVINTTIFSASDYGQIVPVGFATIGNALQINVTVTGLIANGSSFDIVDATSGTTGSTVTATSLSASYAFSAAPSVAGLVTITTTQIPLVIVVGPATPPVVGVIAPVIDALPVTPDTQPILDAIAVLPTPEAVADALAQLAPGAANLSSPRVTFRGTERFQNLLLAHLDEPCGDERPNDERREVRLADAEACQPEDLRPHFWATASGYYGDQDNFDGFEGYDSRTFGGTIAFDVPLSATAHTGLGVTYLRSSLDAEIYDGEGDIESYQATAFLRYAPDDWFMNGFLTYGFDDYEGTRRIVFPGVDATASAEYSGHQYTALAATGYHFYVDEEGTVVTPTATLQYTRLHVDAYTETGAGAINLDVDEQNYDFVQLGLGAKVARDFVASGQVFRPELHAMWLHSLGDEAMKNTAVFTGGGPAFTIQGMSSDASLYEIGAGVTLVGDDAWSLEAGYDYQWNSHNYSAQQAMITLAAVF